MIYKILDVIATVLNSIGDNWMFLLLSLISFSVLYAVSLVIAEKCEIRKRGVFHVDILFAISLSFAVFFNAMFRIAFVFSIVSLIVNVGRFIGFFIFIIFGVSIHEFWQSW